jgi:hypothetical protein
MKRPLTILTLTAGLFAGCATPAPINWDSRIGTYTYDQAVKDYGPPDRQATLTDGRKAAEWYLSYGENVAPVFSAGPGYESGIGVLQTGQQYFEINLHLTFTTNNTLAAWSKD